MKSEIFIPYSGIPLCGGKGSRIESITEKRGSIPKPLLEVGGKKLIQHTIDLMDKTRVGELIFTVGHKAEVIQEWINAIDLPNTVKFAHQTAPGALSAMIDAIPYATQEQLIISNTDEIREKLDLTKAINFHEQTGKIATLITTFANNLSRHRAIERRERDGAVLRQCPKITYPN